MTLRSHDSSGVKLNTNFSSGLSTSKAQRNKNLVVCLPKMTGCLSQPTYQEGISFNVIIDLLNNEVKPPRSWDGIKKKMSSWSA